MRDLGVNDLKDFVCLTSQVKCNSKCDDCSECENKIDKWLAEHDEQIRADERAKTIKDLYASDKSSTLNELLDMARADARRKFAEWLQEKSIFYLDFTDWKKCVMVYDYDEKIDFKIAHCESRNATLDEVLSEYEKEQANE